MPATPVEKAMAAHIVSAVAASRAFSNGSRTENAAGENVIGRTHSDKPIYANRLAHQYKDFTAGDHKDAANAHSHLMEKSRQARDAYESHVDAASMRKSHSGEGSRGGHVIGHTKSGKPIYNSDHPMYHPPAYARFLHDNASEHAPTMHFLAIHAPGWTSQDHLDAAEAHRHGDMRLPSLLHAQAAEEKRDVERSHPPTDRYSEAAVRGKPKLATTTSGHDIHLLGEDSHPTMRHSQTGKPLHTLYGITNHGQEDKAPMLVHHTGKTFVRSGYNSDNGTVHYHEHDPGTTVIDPKAGFAAAATAYNFRKYSSDLKPHAGHLYHVQGDPQIAGGTLPGVIDDPHHGKLSIRGYNTDSHYTVYIRDAIEERMKDLSMGPQEILRRLEQQASGDMGEFITVEDNGEFRIDLTAAKRAGKLRLIKKAGFDQKGRPAIELYDAQAALVALSKRFALMPERQEVTGPDGGPVRVGISYSEALLELKAPTVTPELPEGSRQALPAGKAVGVPEAAGFDAIGL